MTKHFENIYDAKAAAKIHGGIVCAVKGLFDLAFIYVSKHGANCDCGLCPTLQEDGTFGIRRSCPGYDMTTEQQYKRRII